MNTKNSKAQLHRMLSAACLAVFLFLTACEANPEPQPTPPAIEETAAPPAETPVTPPTQTPQPAPTERPLSTEEMNGRVRLLQIAKSQLGSEGQILDGGVESGLYYTQWYVGGDYANGWNEETPWCGAFVSWAVVQTVADSGVPADFTPFASMEEGVGSFREGGNGQWLTADIHPLPGDLVFFDRDLDGTPDHVGLVTAIRDGLLLTVEGNSNQTVEKGSYLPTDARIFGYGVLNWQ